MSHQRFQRFDFLRNDKNVSATEFNRKRSLAVNKLRERERERERERDLNVKWHFTPLSTVFHSDSSHYSCPSWVSPALAWGSGVSCPRSLLPKAQRIQCDAHTLAAVTVLILTLLSITQRPFADSVGQDQTARNVQSDL